ncbi:hypothetical protein NC651_016655 [Populus alba x Populus x berolinensis]|nr:hypothetical protein NC651_016655 [Populus alba x Populus x berolinensis]
MPITGNKVWCLDPNKSAATISVQDAVCRGILTDLEYRNHQYNEIHGRGASKKMYESRLFYAINLLESHYKMGFTFIFPHDILYDFLQIPKDLGRLFCEIRLLKTLEHSNIMKFCTYLVDTANRNINFVT